MRDETELYRCFDEGGALLYVGVAISAKARLQSHKRYAAWFDQLARVTVETYPTRDAALDAERTAIAAERPRHNVGMGRTRRTVQFNHNVTAEFDATIRQLAREQGIPLNEVLARAVRMYGEAGDRATQVGEG